MTTPSLATRAWAGYFEARLDQTPPAHAGLKSMCRSGTAWHGNQLNTCCANDDLMRFAIRRWLREYPASAKATVGAAIQIVDNPDEVPQGHRLPEGFAQRNGRHHGQATAMAMASFQGARLVQRRGAISARINVTNTNTTNATELRFANLGIQLYGQNNVMFQAVSLDSAVNYLQASPNTTGGATVLCSRRERIRILTCVLFRKAPALCGWGGMDDECRCGREWLRHDRDSGGTSRKLATIA